MYRLYFIALPFFVIKANCQDFTFTEMVNLTNYKTSKFDHYVSRRGFKPQEYESNCTKYIYGDPKEESAEKYITKYNSVNSRTLSFEKLSDNEKSSLVQKIKENGFVEGILKGNEDTLLYQKNNLSIYIVNKKKGNYYNVVVENRLLPGAKDIKYAEDLLALNSHEQIAAVYGSENVVKDVFIASNGKEQKCSVLFPNSSLEAIFLWQDEKNYRNIQVIRIGGSAHTEGSLNYSKPVEQSSWLSKQGIYIGMSLKELDNINGNEIDFYGWNWNSGGTLTKNNNGRLDFKKISLILNCFNCADADYRRNKINSSTTALEEDRKIHVDTMIILPKAQQ